MPLERKILAEWKKASAFQIFLYREPIMRPLLPQEFAHSRHLFNQIALTFVHIWAGLYLTSPFAATLTTVQDGLE